MEKINQINENLWGDLQDIRASIAEMSIDKVREFVKENKKEVEQLKNEFLETFKNVPSDNPLRIEYLITLGEMGIILYK